MTTKRLYVLTICLLFVNMVAVESTEQLSCKSIQSEPYIMQSGTDYDSKQTQETLEGNEVKSPALRGKRRSLLDPRSRIILSRKACECPTGQTSSAHMETRAGTAVLQIAEPCLSAVGRRCDFEEQSDLRPSMPLPAHLPSCEVRFKSGLKPGEYCTIDHSCRARGASQPHSLPKASEMM